MATFDYTAKDRAGATVSGQVEALDERSAAAAVRERGHTPMRIALARVGESPAVHAGSFVARHFVHPLWTGININHLLYFYRQLATLLDSGMSLGEALRSIGSRIKGKLAPIVLEARDDVARGQPLSEVLSRHPHIFSVLQVSLVRAGEAGGMLGQMVDRIASYIEHELQIRRLISKMMLYPVIILVFAVLAYVCVPNLGTVVNYGMGPFLRAVWPTLRLIIICIIGLIVVLKLVFQFGAARHGWDAAKILPPIVGTVGRKIAMSRFARALSVLYSAGLPIDKSVQIAADACANRAIGNEMKRALPALRAGEGITESMGRTNAVMPIVLDMLATGEKTGNIDASLDKVADYLDDEAETTIHKLGIALFVTMVLIAAVVVGLVVVDFYVKMYGGMAGGM